jgi:hypothetical protein
MLPEWFQIIRYSKVEERTWNIRTKKKHTLEVIVMKTGAAISKICRSSLDDGIVNEKARNPLLFRFCIIIKAATICETIVAQAAPAIPYPHTEQRRRSPTPLITLAAANAFKGPQESFMPRLSYSKHTV